MASLEQTVVRHYTHGALEQAIRDGLRALGRAADDVRPEDLAAIDEFHMGGLAATEALADMLDLQPGMALLDLGSGLGGAARFFARRHSCRVTGIDLTPEYVAVANSLSQLVSLADRVSFEVGSVLDLPFHPASFDRATLIHVGMNIPDKARLCHEVRRVLKRGGLFAVYDVMRTGEGELAFPVPWATSPAASFLERPEHYRDALSSAGLQLLSEMDQRELAVEFFRRTRARVAETGAPPLGLHVLMGEDAPEKSAHMLQHLEAGLIAPIAIVARAPD